MQPVANLLGLAARRCRLPGLFAIVALSLLISCAEAAATVSAASDRIVITTPGARAVITRYPFRLELLRSGGAPALSEVPNHSAPGQELALTADPIAPGLEIRMPARLYAPLSFTVGSERLLQYAGGLWGGDLMSGTRSGVQYSAQHVISATKLGDGITLMLATNDPSGRRLAVTVRPIGAGAIRIAAHAQPSVGVVEMSDSFASGADEGFFGFGGRHNALDQHESVLRSFVEEENVGGLHGPELYPGGATAAYYPQAEFYSSRGYGFLLDQPQLARFALDAERPTAWRVSASASTLDYVVAPGPPATSIRTLTGLSGRQPVPPGWALGPMIDRLVKIVGETRSDYEAAVHADITSIERYRLPLRAYRIEGWGFPSPDNDGFALHSAISRSLQRQVIAGLRRRGIHPLVYMRPWITPGSAPSRRGLVVDQGDGRPYMTTGPAGQKIELLDFTKPAAVRFWQQEVSKAFDLGADGFMQDFGEEVLLDMHFADGETGRTMHNRYLILYARATREEIEAYERRHPARRLWFFSRAGYSGLPGSTAYEGANFPGDETTDWSHASGLASLTSDMLGRAVDGAYGYGADIGGYFDIAAPPTTKELFIRWAEWAALTPVFRLHGSGFAGTHMPWSYDSQTLGIYRSLSRLHLSAAPLILELWRRAAQTGMPITRPLWIQDPRSRAARSADQEWLLGPDVLVAPVVTRGARARSLYFPPGCWQAPGTSETHQGAGTATVAAPLATLPYFFRCGTRPFAAIRPRKASRTDS